MGQTITGPNQRLCDLSWLIRPTIHFQLEITVDYSSIIWLRFSPRCIECGAV